MNQTLALQACQNCSIHKELEEEVVRLRKENADLKRRLMRYENPHTPSSLRRRYPRRTGSHTKNGERFPGRPKGYKGRTRPRPKPDYVKVPERKSSCDHCGFPLHEPVHVRHHLIEEIEKPKQRQAIDFLEFEYKCTVCNTFSSVRHPECPPDGLFGKNVLIQTTLMKFEQRLPLEKISQQMESQFGLPLTAASVLDITRRVSEYLMPEYNTILEEVRGSSIVYVDETGEKVDGKKNWLWVFVAPPRTLFVISKSRGKQVLEQVLGRDFEGFIGCDGWKSYSNFTTNLQRCWAHLLREAEWLAEHCKEAKPLYLGLKRLYAGLVELLMDDPSPSVRRKLKAAAKNRLRYWLGKGYKSEITRKFVQKMRNGFDHWFTFVTVPGLEPTNNRAERALKEPVVQRKIMGTFRNGKGTWIYETIMTLLATWKQQGLNPHKAMAQSLTTAWTKNS